MTNERQIYLACAAQLLNSDPSHALAQRYLTIVRRRRILKRAARKARRLAIQGSALSTIGFQPPLSVAGHSSAAIVRAEGLLLEGFPVAVMYGPDGNHVGTALDDAIDALTVESGGREWSMDDVFTAYRVFMASTPGLLSKHPVRRFRCLPRLLRQNRQERDDLEGRLHEYIRAHDTRMFAAAIDSEVFATTLDALEARGPLKSVVLGFRAAEETADGTVKILRVNGVPARALWGHGNGGAVVSVQDLRQLIGAPGTAVSLDCDLHGWDGVCDLPIKVFGQMTDLEAPEPQRFAYFTDGGQS